MKHTSRSTKAFLILLLTFALVGALTVSKTQAQATLTFTSYQGTANVQSDGIVEVTDSSVVNLGMGDLTQPQPSGTGEQQTLQAVSDAVFAGTPPGEVCGANAGAGREAMTFFSDSFSTQWDFKVVFASQVAATVGCTGLTQSADIHGTFTGQLVVPANTPGLTINVNLMVTLCGALCGGTATGTTTLQITDSGNNLIVNQAQNGDGTAAQMVNITPPAGGETYTIIIDGTGSAAAVNCCGPSSTVSARLTLTVSEPPPAPTACTFTTVGTTMTLDADCTTDATILVPNGFTLDGAGKTITAEDPPSGHFLGAVVMNAGPFAVVKNLTIDTNGLSNVCDEPAPPADNRLRGILFRGASGIIMDNTILNINQGASGCQEGNGIEVRNAPFTEGGTDVLVWISGNTVTNYQKTGIVANGSVAATIIGNTVTGVGPVNYIAQNGIQIGFGGTAIVQENDISGNDYTPRSFVSCGLLMFDADGVRASQNHYANNERNVCVFGRGGGQYNPEP